MHYIDQSEVAGEEDTVHIPAFYRTESSDVQVGFTLSDASNASLANRQYLSLENQFTRRLGALQRRKTGDSVKTSFSLTAARLWTSPTLGKRPARRSALLARRTPRRIRRRASWRREMSLRGSPWGRRRSVPALPSARPWWDFLAVSIGIARGAVRSRERWGGVLMLLLLRNGRSVLRNLDASWHCALSLCVGAARCGYTRIVHVLCTRVLSRMPR